VRAFSLTALLCVAFTTSSARAQLRPTGDELSVHGGRTQGNGEVVVSGGVGWPGFWVDVALAPTSRFNLGFRAHVDYGALVGTRSGFGGGLSVPMRILVYADGKVDVSFVLTPFIGLGEGSYVGQGGIFGDDLGIAGSLDIGPRLSSRVSSMTTLNAGAFGTLGLLSTPSADDTHVFGAAVLMGSIELVMNRSTMLFAEVRVGYAFVPSELFGSPLYLRGSVGMAYRL
jgi:hypothetical protein